MPVCWSVGGLPVHVSQSLGREGRKERLGRPRKHIHTRVATMTLDNGERHAVAVDVRPFTHPSVSRSPDVIEASRNPPHASVSAAGPGALQETAPRLARRRSPNSPYSICDSSWTTGRTVGRSLGLMKQLRLFAQRSLTVCRCRGDGSESGGRTGDMMMFPGSASAYSRQLGEHDHRGTFGRCRRRQPADCRTNGRSAGRWSTRMAACGRALPGRQPQTHRYTLERNAA